MGLLLFYDTETPPMALQVHESRNLRQARRSASVLTCHVSVGYASYSLTGL